MAVAGALQVGFSQVGAATEGGSVITTLGLAAEYGPESIRVDWGSADALGLGPQIVTYLPGEDGSIAMPGPGPGRGYADGDYVIKIRATSPGGEIEKTAGGMVTDSVTVTAFIDANGTTAVSKLGDTRDNLMVGGSGADTFNGSRGDDWLSGGDGDDSLLGGAGRDSLAGGDGKDSLAGGADDDWLSGGAGADRLNAGAGSDTILGGDGRDAISVGADGALDLFVYNAPSEGGDKLTGFEAGLDRIALLFLTDIDAAHVVDSAGAMTDTGAHVVYDAASGALSVDLDGTGSGKAVLMVTLADAPALAYGDLWFAAGA